MVTPYPNFLDRPLLPKYGNGMDRGWSQLTGNSVDHSMLGTLSGTDTYFRLNWVAASTHWGIGGALDGDLDGVIYRWIETPSEMIPWASGPWTPPGFSNGGEYVDVFGVDGINAEAESIELSGQEFTPVTVKQWQSLIQLKAAIAHAGGKTSDEKLWWMHHRDFTTPRVKRCPFARVYDHTNEYFQATVWTMQFYEGHLNVPLTARIAGLNVPLPLGKKPPVIVPPATPIYVSFDKPYPVILRSATARQYGNRNAKVIKNYKAGDEVMLTGFYIGEPVNDNPQWYTVDSEDRERIHESGIKEWKEVPK